MAELLAGSNAAECHREDVAGLGAAAKLQTSLGAAAESHREDAADRRCGRTADRLGRSGKVAGWGAVAKRQAGNAAVAKRLLAEAPWQSRRRQRGIPVARERQWQGNATADWHGNAAGD